MYNKNCGMHTVSKSITVGRGWDHLSIIILFCKKKEKKKKVNNNT